MEHTCTKEECGWRCWIENGKPTCDVHFDGVDGEGPCQCDGHDE